MIEFDHGIVRPQLAADLFPQDDSTRVGQQHAEDLQRLLLKADGRAVLRQFAGAEIEFKRPKADTARC